MLHPSLPAALPLTASHLESIPLPYGSCSDETPSGCIPPPRKHLESSRCSADVGQRPPPTPGHRQLTQLSSSPSPHQPQAPASSCFSAQPLGHSRPTAVGKTLWVRHSLPEAPLAFLQAQEEAEAELTGSC